MLPRPSRRAIHTSIHGRNTGGTAIGHQLSPNRKSSIENPRGDHPLSPPIENRKAIIYLIDPTRPDASRKAAKAQRKTSSLRLRGFPWDSSGSAHSGSLEYIVANRKSQEETTTSLPQSKIENRQSKIPGGVHKDVLRPGWHHRRGGFILNAVRHRSSFRTLYGLLESSVVLSCSARMKHPGGRYDIV